jgi:hypothetical protein
MASRLCVFPFAYIMFSCLYEDALVVPSAPPKAQTMVFLEATETEIGLVYAEAATQPGSPPRLETQSDEIRWRHMNSSEKPAHDLGSRVFRTIF